MGNINISKMLNIYNYFDGVIITDEKGVIKYYTNFRTDLYNLRLDEVIGKTIMEIHPEIKEEDSTIMNVLKTKKPIYDHIEHLTTLHGDSVTNVCSTLPIMQGGRIVGAIDFSRCIDDEFHKNIERRQIVIPNISTKDEKLYNIEDIITTSKKINEIKKMIPMIASTESAVMIYGETGTGKEMIAQSIHSSGPRASKPFVSQNCAAIPDTLLESIMFGATKGSFTGAEDKAGLFEIANGGTIFLDEINSMSMVMQAKILKTIEEKKVKRIGSNEFMTFDVKVLCALNQDPIKCMKENIIREDLFYRLSTVLIEIPPLRDRIADIPFMVNYFIGLNNLKMNKNVMGVSSEVMEILCNYNWPGNVRELKNIVEGAFNVIGSNIINIKDLPAYMFNLFEKEHKTLLKIDDNLSLEDKVYEYEKRIIIMALDSTKNITQAAKKLKISKQTLNYKLLKFGLKSKR
ncbi:MAG: sigma 54-interacting transcriptional regulator [Sedimentibacter saalensis]|jgi:arginine utilization regulatory protein|uniref:Arginine utilization regulatory protein n=1 Tax=Sedimentibacter saalensis TaxID=130788 RepID=A0A562J507_9FIRM|nr:sigma 54-interacting transcriptional regulator [Sedimentibacter saalensis]MEA5096183.1 sigma 54-interacting transcriptional regulator [Sedimentibacter saalensis]TWH78187.1 arginine utilization regulatory protein [Sedimentibacter saalensis]